MTAPATGPRALLPRLRQRWLQAQPRSPRARGAVLVVAAAVTVVAVVIAADRLALTGSDLRLGPLLVAGFLVTPLTIVLNAAELRVTARASGATLARVGWGRALRTVVLATAANLLPVPAGAALRIQVLRDAGARLAAAAGVQLAAASVWVGASVGLAGVGVVVVRGTAPVSDATFGGVAVGLLAVLAIAGGLALVVAGSLAVRRTATERPAAAAGGLLAVETATAVLHAGRLWLVLLGLGVAAALPQAFVIGVATPLAAAAGFFPGGIGAAELLSALLAPLAGLDAAAGLLAVAVARLLGLALTVPVALALGLRDLAAGRGPST